MSEFLASYERVLLGKLKKDDQSAFSVVFTQYYSDLVRFSFKFTNDLNISEEIVQDVFLRLWENRSSLEIHTSLKSYLLKNVQNRSIDSLRHTGITNQYVSMVLNNVIATQNDTENYVFFSELQANYNNALKKIPVQYADVFRMSRMEGLKYQEIADVLGVSVRTVEVRLSKALVILREELKDFLLLYLIILKLLT
ncbi:MAG: RNA polymerase sigma-70 factor [Lentimicrobium sp.]|nr:RNA polymerase sigma-70 factor [Lentimicrobium sp.]